MIIDTTKSRFVQGHGVHFGSDSAQDEWPGGEFRLRAILFLRFCYAAMLLCLCLLKDCHAEAGPSLSFELAWGLGVLAGLF